MFLNQTLLLINIVALLWRILLIKYQYQCVAIQKEEDLPEITVVVPAYNEGKGVLETIQSLVYSNYPESKLHIIAIDDGSHDDTWECLTEAQKRWGEKICILRFSENQGKRCALYHGFKRSKGDVLVTVDSDSILDQDSLRYLVSPFQNARVGAVAGNVRILNRKEGFIPRMLDVSFAYSFEFIRASQSCVNAVMCTPGALSAYRKDIVMLVLEEWLHQKFLGQKATIGEDRAMTNFILRAGYHVSFQSKATVYTKVPIKYTKLCKMFLRWARSNIRETLVMTAFAFKKFRSTPASGMRVNLLLHWTTLTFLQILRLQTILYFFISPYIFGVHLFLGAAIISLFPAIVYWLKYHNSNGFWAFPYGIFWILSLSWITPYAMLTPYKNSWMTRDLDKAQK
ncbi:MAG: glycosyltransferase family 2 protein [Candidatus Brocadiae bacterium]|nr:glycosyltransferase family 2 protein [Candidatus Brocadiia bacterium]